MFILDFALDVTAAKCCVFLSRGDLVADFEGGTETGITEGQRLEDLLLCPSSEVLAREDFESLSEQDKAGIGVLHPRAGGRFDWELQKGTKERGWRGCGLIERNVAGKTGVMSEEMAKCDAPRVFDGWAPDDKAREQVAEGCFEIELAALMQEHRGCRGRDDLRNAGDVEDSLGGDRACSFVIGEVAESILKDDGAGSKDAKRAAWKGLGSDCFLENRVRGDKMRIGNRVEIAGCVFSGLHGFPA